MFSQADPGPREESRDFVSDVVRALRQSSANLSPGSVYCSAKRPCSTSNSIPRLVGDSSISLGLPTSSGRGVSLEDRPVLPSERAAEAITACGLVCDTSLVATEGSTR